MGYDLRSRFLLAIFYGFGDMDAYFAMSKQFDGRKKSGKELRLCDLSEFTHLFYETPQYVKLVAKERVNPGAERFSPEGRLTKIRYIGLTLADIEGVRKENNAVVLKIKAGQNG